MTSIADLLAALTAAQESLPHNLIEPYQRRWDAVSEQVAVVLRTSADEQAVLATITHARDHGAAAITTSLNQAHDVIASASSTW